MTSPVAGSSVATAVPVVTSSIGASDPSASRTSVPGSKLLAHPRAFGSARIALAAARSARWPILAAGKSGRDDVEGRPCLGRTSFGWVPGEVGHPNGLFGQTGLWQAAWEWSRTAQAQVMGSPPYQHCTLVKRFDKNALMAADLRVHSKE